MARNPGRQTIDERIVELYGDISRYEGADDPTEVACDIVDDLPETLQVMGEQLIDDVLQMRLADALRGFVERALADPQTDLRDAMSTIRAVLDKDFPHTEEALADLPEHLTAGSNVWRRGNARVADLRALTPTSAAD